MQMDNRSFLDSWPIVTVGHKHPEAAGAYLQTRLPVHFEALLKYSVDQSGNVSKMALSRHHGDTAKVAGEGRGFPLRDS